MFEEFPIFTRERELSARGVVAFVGALCAAAFALGLWAGGRGAGFCWAVGVAAFGGGIPFLAAFYAWRHVGGRLRRARQQRLHEHWLTIPGAPRPFVAHYVHACVEPLSSDTFLMMASNAGGFYVAGAVLRAAGARWSEALVYLPLWFALGAGACGIVLILLYASMLETVICSATPVPLVGAKAICNRNAPLDKILRDWERENRRELDEYWEVQSASSLWRGLGDIALLFLARLRRWWLELAVIGLLWLAIVQ